MSNPGFSITIHMVSSLDGIIAKSDNSISWFESSSPYEKGVSGENAEEFLKTIDCYVMGSGHLNTRWNFQKATGGPMATRQPLCSQAAALPAI